MKKEKNYYGLIMAGGQGTRFWPWSTAQKPKQFLNIVGSDPLITQTFDRLKNFIPRENIFIVADGCYLEAVKEAIPGFKESNYIAEPAPRNTAPCLILANIILSRLESDATLAVVPADHYIPDSDVYASQFRDALEYAENKCIITSGIKPDSPHTGYGYIKFDAAQKEKCGHTEFFKVNEFKEKPAQPKAQEYLDAGNYYWNAGMFIYKLKYFKEFLAEYSPYYYEQYGELEKVFDRKEQFSEKFKAIEPESIDYALMEKVKEVRMFPAAFSWSDVGAWSSVFELNEKGQGNNMALKENHVFIDAKDSMIFSTSNTPVAVIGLENVAVINTENGILVAHMDALQKVKEVSKKLKK